MVEDAQRYGASVGVLFQGRVALIEPIMLLSKYRIHLYDSCVICCRADHHNFVF